MRSLRSPTYAVCKLEAQKIQWVVYFILSLKAWEPGNSMLQVPVQGQEKAVRQKKVWILLSFTFCCIEALNILESVHWLGGGQSALLSQLTKMLSHLETSKKQCVAKRWSPCDPDKLTIIDAYVNSLCSQSKKKFWYIQAMIRISHLPKKRFGFFAFPSGFFEPRSI